MFAFSHNLFQTYASTVSRYKTAWSSIVIDYLWYNQQFSLQVSLEITEEIELDFGPGNSNNIYCMPFLTVLQIDRGTDGSTCQQTSFLLVNKWCNCLLKDLMSFK